MGSLFNVDRSRRYDSVHGLQFMLTRETPQDPPQAREERERWGEEG